MHDIIAEVSKFEFDITMHPAAVSKMVKKPGLTPQRPVRKAWQQDEKKLESGWIHAIPRFSGIQRDSTPSSTFRRSQLPL